MPGPAVLQTAGSKTYGTSPASVSTQLAGPRGWGRGGLRRVGYRAEVVDDLLDLAAR
jgi:hypothetical protein